MVCQSMKCNTPTCNMAQPMPYYVHSSPDTMTDQLMTDEALELAIDETIEYETYDELMGDEYADAVLSTLS